MGLANPFVVSAGVALTCGMTGVAVLLWTRLPFNRRNVWASFSAPSILGLITLLFLWEHAGTLKSWACALFNAFVARPLCQWLAAGEDDDDDAT